MKKFVAIILVLYIAMSLVGCAPESKSSENNYDAGKVDGTFSEEEAYEDIIVNNDNNPNAQTQPKNNYQSEYVSSNNVNNDNNPNVQTQSPNNYQSEYVSSDNTQSQVHTHTWQDATCTEKAKCIVCGETTGTTTSHQYTQATCTERAKCTVCGKSNGDKAEHNYVKTCTTPETCTVCGDKRGSVVLGHDFFNDTCLKCGEKLTIPFTVEYPSQMSYELHGETTYFSVQQYNIIDLDLYSEGYSRISITLLNETGGRAHATIVFYDKNGRILDTSSMPVMEAKGSTYEFDPFIPISTTKIIIKSYQN